MPTLYESDIEELVIELLQNQGYTYLSPEAQEQERDSLSDVVLRGRLKDAIDNLNPDIPEDAREHALREVLSLSSQSLIENNLFLLNNAITKIRFLVHPSCGTNLGGRLLKSYGAR